MEYNNSKIVRVNLISLRPNTKYDICIILNNQAGNSTQQCQNVLTLQEPITFQGKNSSLQTTITLTILAIVLLILIVVIDMSCHYMNECGIFSTIVRSRQDRNSNSYQRETMLAEKGFANFQDSNRKLDH